MYFSFLIRNKMYFTVETNQLSFGADWTVCASGTSMNQIFSLCCTRVVERCGNRQDADFRHWEEPLCVKLIELCHYSIETQVTTQPQLTSGHSFSSN